MKRLVIVVSLLVCTGCASSQQQTRLKLQQLETLHAQGQISEKDYSIYRNVYEYQLTHPKQSWWSWYWEEEKKYLPLAAMMVSQSMATTPPPQPKPIIIQAPPAYSPPSPPSNMSCHSWTLGSNVNTDCHSY